MRPLLVHLVRFCKSPFFVASSYVERFERTRKREADPSRGVGGRGRGARWGWGSAPLIEHTTSAARRRYICEAEVGCHSLVCVAPFYAAFHACFDCVVGWGFNSGSVWFFFSRCRLVSLLASWCYEGRCGRAGQLGRIGGETRPTFLLL